MRFHNITQHCLNKDKKKIVQHIQAYISNIIAQWFLLIFFKIYRNTIESVREKIKERVENI